MKVLLTRPQGRNQSMIEALSERQIPFVVSPLLEVVATDDIKNPAAIAAFNHADMVIFISTNAVEYAAKALNNQFPHSVSYFAVGKATFEALASLGVKATEAPQDCQQTEGLLTLSELQRLDGKQITIVRGVGGREALADQLQTRGANVSYWQVYQRAAPTIDPLLPQSWQQQDIDTIVVTSGEILSNLVTLVPKELFDWLLACHIIVPSERVYNQAQQAGFTRITNAQAANSHAVLSALGLAN
ncbi:uroporphyrinogen-III synthase [Shewanella sp. Isolate11]|uniref:uroporphyrinogen-III synthase n=1 Tax=Shewanella sp. Isolate11 TaxID=2908530 RepID=UPI001EFEE24E|nr:uroporphyrinogen-III synthase [Shewanella sp. Isolate11]MCG9695425.1 uroporphyrinogen-III synthase [Shewanella sp. Isolate11]